ncbi:MAG: hypothetical protein ACJ8MR_06545 [Povalibacter sp.]
MRKIAALSMIAVLFTPCVRAAEVDARPPDRLTLAANGSTLTDTDGGYGGSLNWLHYFTPDVIMGLGAEHQTIADAQFSFGALRGSWGYGQPSSRFNVYGEVQYGQGDENNRDFDYKVGVLSFSQNFGSKLSVQLEGRQIDIDTTHGNLPKLGITYLWSPHWLTNVAYANSTSGNVNTELTTARVDHYGRYVNFIVGGATGQADPVVLNLQPGLTLPTNDLTEGFFGIGKSFSRGEVLLLADYLKLADSEKVTVTLSFTAYVGSRGRPK